MKTRIFSYFLILTLALTTCSATWGRIRQQSTGPSTVYLPMVNNLPPYSTLFGVDGNTSLDRMKTAGVKWLRLNTQLSWADVEATQGTYDWSKAVGVENRLIDAANNDLNVILVIQGAPVWARTDPNSQCGPILESKYDAFGAFLNRVVQRYSQPPYNVRYYQIWNEPDGTKKDETVYGCWAEATDSYFGGTAYGKMLAKVYPMMKVANANAQVVMGSMMLVCDARDPNPENYCATESARRTAKFFEGVMQDGRYSFDAVMFNSGPSFVSDENPVWTERNNWRWKAERGGLVDGKISYLRGIMAKYGVNKPLIHSEAYLLDKPNEPTIGADALVSEQFEMYKADYLVWVYANGWSQDLKTVIWYTIDGWKGSELLVSGAQETLAYQALVAMTALVQNSNYISRDNYPEYTRFIFRASSEDIWLLVPTGRYYGQGYSIPKPANFKRAVNIYGVEQVVSGSTISFNRPYYVVVSH